ncbi:MAG: hypothetical protein ACI8Z5_002557 [Lentimonas sp.]|jgi:hypothetical protein
MPSRSARAQPYPYSTQKRSWNHECTRIGTYKYFMFNHLSSLTPQGTIRFNFARLATHKIATPSPTSCPFVVSKTEPKPTAESELNNRSWRRPTFHMSPWETAECSLKGQSEPRLKHSATAYITRLHYSTRQSHEFSSNVRAALHSVCARCINSDHTNRKLWIAPSITSGSYETLR